MKASNSSLTIAAGRRRQRLRHERRESRRAAAPSSTAWSVPVGGARSGQGCHPAPARAASRWLARRTPEVVSPHGLKPCAVPQSPFVLPADVCPLVRGLHRVPVCGSDRRLRGGEIGTPEVGSGSILLKNSSSTFPTTFAGVLGPLAASRSSILGRSERSRSDTLVALQLTCPLPAVPA